MASALMKEVQELKARVGSIVKSESIVIGIFEPSDNGPSHVKSIERIEGEWVETNKEYSATLSLAMLPALLSKKRFVNIVGGRGSGKSQGEACIVVVDMHDAGIKTACFREFQNSIEDSVYSLLESQINRMGLTGFTLINNAVRSANGAEAKFKGLARNPDSVKSMDGFKRFWVEEAQASSENSLKLLTPTMREEGGQIVFTANPGSSEDPFSKRFINPFSDELELHGIYEDELHLILMVNWRDNPWFPTELNQERLWDFENLPRALYDHIWEGKFNDSVENGLIMAEWFDACVDAHIKLDFGTGGIKKVTHDPSDVGSDPKALSLREGNVFTEVKERDDLDVNDGCDWATGYAIEVSADQFEWDVGGMGTGLKKQVNDSLQGKKMEIFMFNGASGVDDPDSIYQPALGENIQNEKNNKEMFKNLRGQCYSSVRDRVYKTYKAVIHHKMYDPDELISFSSGIANLSKLRSELCRMPIKPNGSGLFELYTKEQMRKMFKVSSPNLADCVMMSERIHIKEMGFQGDINQLNIPMVNHW
jgi:phage terminase large subunit